MAASRQVLEKARRLNALTAARRIRSYVDAWCIFERGRFAAQETGDAVHKCIADAFSLHSILQLDKRIRTSTTQTKHRRDTLISRKRP
jgi:hypothetical protein